MKLYIEIGSTIPLDDDAAHYYQGFAFNHFHDHNEAFRMAVENIPQKGSVKVTRTVIQGPASDDADELVDQLGIKFLEWQPSLKKFDF
jgi:hypothetical protein